MKISKEIREIRVKSEEVPNVKRNEMMLKDREEGEKIRMCMFHAKIFLCHS